MKTLRTLGVMVFAVCAGVISACGTEAKDPSSRSFEDVKEWTFEVEWEVPHRDAYRAKITKTGPFSGDLSLVITLQGRNEEVANPKTLYTGKLGVMDAAMIYRATARLHRPRGKPTASSTETPNRTGANAMSIDLTAVSGDYIFGGNFFYSSKGDNLRATLPPDVQIIVSFLMTRVSKAEEAQKKAQAR